MNYNSHNFSSANNNNDKNDKVNIQNPILLVKCYEPYVTVQTMDEHNLLKYQIAINADINC